MNAEPSADRDLIVAAADRLFYRRGIQSVGMDEVRTESGVPLKRLYAAFPSKDALVLEVLRTRRQTWDAGLAAAASTAATAEARLLAVYDFLDDWFRTDDFRGCGFINAFGELGAVLPAVAGIAQQQKDDFQAYVSRLVEQLGAPPLLAAQLALLAEGAQQPRPRSAGGPCGGSGSGRRGDTDRCGARVEALARATDSVRVESRAPSPSSN